MVFIGRAEERQRFCESVESLSKGEVPCYRVYLIYGEGGFGKTWLLYKYQTIAQDKGIPSIYFDCEKEQISQEGGTYLLMQALMRHLQEIDDHLRNGAFEYIQKMREKKEGIRPSQIEYSRAFIEDVRVLLRKYPLVILLDTWEKVQAFASNWLGLGLMGQLLRSEEGRHVIFVVAGRLTDDFILNIRDTLHEFQNAIYRRPLETFTKTEVQEYLEANQLQMTKLMSSREGSRWR